MSSLAKACALPLVAAAVIVLTAAPAAATTYRTIVVDGDLSDWDVATEKRPDDPLNDSRFTPGMDELSRLFVTWDADALYIAYDFVVQQDAVIYYIQGPGSGNTTNFCNVDDFKAAVTTSEPMDVMLGFFDVQTVFGYKLAGGHSTLEPTIITARTPNASGAAGAVEAKIPWATLFGAGATTVPANATIKIAGVVRGTNDGDFLGDVNPGAAAAAAGDTCSGGNAVAQLTQYHVIHVDSDGDGTPDQRWNPGTDSAAGPLPDGGVGVDMGTPAPDMVIGGVDASVSDVPVAASDAVAPGNDLAVGGSDARRADGPGADVARLDATPAHDVPASDRHVLTSPDGTINPATPAPGGCACALGGPTTRPPLGSFLLIALYLGCVVRRRRGRR